MRKFTGTIKKMIPAAPVWSNQLRKPSKKISSLNAGKERQEVIYFSSCISRMMGGDIGSVFLSVCKKANINVIIPGQINGTCCGQIFSSKGFVAAHNLTANLTIEKLWKSSRQGFIPIVIDVTSCTQTIRSYRNYLSDENKIRYDNMTFIDVIDFAAERLLPALKISRQKESIVFHPVCSVYKMGSLNNLHVIGKACASNADIPFFAKCCGMAGDRGFYYPQLTTSATKSESNEVRQKQYDGYYSSSRTCEMALSDAVGQNYESILRLLDEVSEL